MVPLRSPTCWICKLAGFGCCTQESGRPHLAASRICRPLAENLWRWKATDSTPSAGDLAGAANVNVVTCSRPDLVDGANGLRYHASIPLYAHGRQLGVAQCRQRRLA